MAAPGLWRSRMFRSFRLLTLLLVPELASFAPPVPVVVVEARYPNGQLWYRRTYRDGREDGVHTGWWADGRIHFVYTYRDGLIEGLAREWFPNGRRYREFHYVAGQEEGSEQMWYTDGKLRANYVVRNGRRFGLPGTKGCTGLDTTVVIP